MAAEPGPLRPEAGEAGPSGPSPEPPSAGPPADLTLPPPAGAARGADDTDSTDIADGVERPLDPRWKALQHAVGWIRAGVLGLGLLVPLAPMVLYGSFPAWVDGLLVLAWCGVALLLVWSALQWPGIEHRHAAYRVDRQGIQIRRGVFWRKVIDVPRSRVQHTDVSQGPLERRLGLGTLVVYTAGTAHAKVELPGLDHARALAIRDHLLPGQGDDAL